MKKIFFATIIFSGLFSLTGSTQAADHYVRDGGTGDCSDWTEACDTLPAVLQRGDTYYVAGGNYGSYTFDDPVSGTSLIAIKKATVADHGTEAGWEDIYASGQAVWSYWGITQGYYAIDGQTGGGPDSWSSGHGIAVRNLSAHLVWSNTSVNNITIRHVELDGTSNASADRDAIYLIGGSTNFVMQYAFVHDIGCDFAQLRGDHTGFIMEYSLWRNNNQDAACHGDVFEYDGGTALNWVHRYNWFDDCQGTYLWGAHGSGTLSNAEIYGNVITGGLFDNGLIAGLSAGGTITGLKFYNNTIVTISNNNAGFLYLSRGTNNLIYNNIWYNSPATMDGIHDYNWFYGSGDQSETHIQNGSGDPFVNITADNYELTTATNPGDSSIGIEYNTDMKGIARGADGTWDRGAYEYVSGDTTPPDAPSGLSVS